MQKHDSYEQNHFDFCSGIRQAEEALHRLTSDRAVEDEYAAPLDIHQSAVSTTIEQVERLLEELKDYRRHVIGWHAEAREAELQAKAEQIPA